VSSSPFGEKASQVLEFGWCSLASQVHAALLAILLRKVPKFTLHENGDHNDPTLREFTLPCVALLVPHPWPFGERGWCNYESEETCVHNPLVDYVLHHSPIGDLLAIDPHTHTEGFECLGQLSDPLRVGRSIREKDVVIRGTGRNAERPQHQSIK